MTITGPCGHTHSIDAAYGGRPDHWHCPQCQTRWHVQQDPPRRLPSGFVMPGDRRIIVGYQPQKPNPTNPPKVK